MCAHIVHYHYYSSATTEYNLTPEMVSTSSTCSQGTTFSKEFILKQSGHTE